MYHGLTLFAGTVGHDLKPLQLKLERSALSFLLASLPNIRDRSINTSTVWHELQPRQKHAIPAKTLLQTLLYTAYLSLSIMVDEVHMCMITNIRWHTST